MEAAAAADTSVARELQAQEALYASQGISDVRMSAVRGRVAAAKAQHDQADTALRLARTTLAYATIRSPITGVVSDRSVDVGQTIAPGMPLYHLQDLSELELEAQVDERVAAQVTPGLAVDALGDEAHLGRRFEVLSGDLLDERQHADRGLGGPGGERGRRRRGESGSGPQEQRQ